MSGWSRCWNCEQATERLSDRCAACGAGPTVPDVSLGHSTCPVCGKHWLVTPQQDCFLPGCGCFGHDVSANNPERPCHDCGWSHIRLIRCPGEWGRR